MRKTLEERLWEKIEIKGSCWVWKGTPHKNGRGYIKVKSKATRIAWVMLHLIGVDVPKGAFICHRCDNPICCNPAHLFIGTHQDNVDDMVSKGRQTKTIPFSTINEIRRMYETEYTTQRGLAEKFKVSQSAVAKITAYKRRLIS